MTRDDILDTDPITLGRASKLLLHGEVSESALRAEIKRGTLKASKVGKNLFTTPADIRRMFELCRVSPVHPDSTSDQTTEPGSSATEARTTELDALNESVRRLKFGSRNTSPKSTQTNQQSAANPIPFPSPKC